MVRQGIPKVKKGEEIQQGQVLVSGRVPVIGDDEQEISAFYVQSQGEILAETVETYEKRTASDPGRALSYRKETLWSAPDRRSFFLFISYA